MKAYDFECTKCNKKMRHLSYIDVNTLTDENFGSDQMFLSVNMRRETSVSNRVSGLSFVRMLQITVDQSLRFQWDINTTVIWRPIVPLRCRRSILYRNINQFKDTNITLHYLLFLFVSIMNVDKIDVIFNLSPKEYHQ